MSHVGKNADMWLSSFWPVLPTAMLVASVSVGTNEKAPDLLPAATVDFKYSLQTNLETVWCFLLVAFLPAVLA